MSCAIIVILFVGLIIIIHYTNPFMEFYKPYEIICPHCHIGKMTIQEHGEWGDIIETKIPCSECGCDYSLKE